MKIETRQRSEQVWSVLCRTCNERIELDACPYVSFGSGASMKPGAILCAQGHHHLYFPRDFGFVPTPVEAPFYSLRAA